ncbi:hypothetical protein R3P38DRAFT_2477106, partial [Favolaschia claudopus]
FPDPGEFIREHTGIHPSMPVTLSSVATPPDGQKPQLPLVYMILLAIYGSPMRKLALKEICDSIRLRFPIF